MTYKNKYNILDYNIKKRSSFPMVINLMVAKCLPYVSIELLHGGKETKSINQIFKRNPK